MYKTTSAFYPEARARLIELGAQITTKRMGGKERYWIIAHPQLSWHRTSLWEGAWKGAWRQTMCLQIGEHKWVEESSGKWHYAGTESAY